MSGVVAEMRIVVQGCPTVGEMGLSLKGPWL